MGFLDTDFGKMILFMILGIVLAIVLLGYHKSPKADLSSALKKRTPTLPKTAAHNSTSRNPYEPEL